MIIKIIVTITIILVLSLCTVLKVEYSGGRRALKPNVKKARNEIRKSKLLLTSAE